MSTRIGLIGDPHATPEPLAEALTILRNENVDAIWCTGDIAGYGTELDRTVLLLQENGCRTICGNHDLWYLEKTDQQAVSSSRDYIKNLPRVIREEREGASVCMVHASPPQSVMKGIRLLDEHSNVIEEEKRIWAEQLTEFAYDLLIVGHTHQVFAERLGDTLVINSGSTRFNHCCAALTLPDRTVEWFPLSGQMIRHTWNWGEEYKR